MPINVHHGDCLEVMRQLVADGVQVDAAATDAPYHLTSIVKRFGKPGSAPAQEGTDGRFARASRGFMGQQWDGGDIAFRVELWELVFQILKPGAHLVAFSHARTYHRMACAIEDAGFEIRDQIGWLYGSGFPKSHDVSKALDKRKDWHALTTLQDVVRSARVALGISQSEAARRMGLIAEGESLGGGGFMWFETGHRVPTREQWPRLKAALGLGDTMDAAFEAAEREVIGQHDEGTSPGGFGDHRFKFNSRDITASATDAAKKWEGWGTALKPAWEPIVLARKPLIGTVAENVVQLGTGAVNIEGCRVPGGEDGDRWPANVIHDGSQEVIDAFDDGSGSSAARFFYSAKADADDRLGSKHPTVKPVDLMAYLCRMITRPGGVVLDPFAGSGTTGMACMREGFGAILIEREAEYVADIKRRVAHVKGEDTPLFQRGAA